MTNFAAKIAGLATLALAAVPVAALSTAAHATPAAVKVAIADLDLSSKSGMSAFDQRVARAGRLLCRDERTLSAQDSCALAVRMEAREKLTAYLNGRSAPTVVATAR
jgi:UrcA family protein